jgi:3-oxoacyl-[acyl-carrier protein] reductase
MGDGLLIGKAAVVTGAGRGIGREIALSLAREGASVVVNALNAKAGFAGATASNITGMGVKALAHYGDVADFEVARELIETAVGAFGRVDILVNNAGISGHGMPWDMSEADWDRMIAVHLKGTFKCTRHVAGCMRDHASGRIINCTSGAWFSRAGGCHYAAAKAGIVGFTRAVAMVMASCGVTCNAYHPFAMTELMGPQTRYTVEERFKHGKIDREEYEWQSNAPGPEGVGPLVAYLASPAAANITGRVFYVSGGKVAIYSEPVRLRTIHKPGSIWSMAELAERVPGLLAE